MTVAVGAEIDERPTRAHPLLTVLRRPEVGALVAAVAIFLFFSLSTQAFLTPAGISTWLYSASLFGIMAVAVALLMIGGSSTSRPAR